MNYSLICNHVRLSRIDSNFVRCLDCGQSMISQEHISTNKSQKDFVKENKSFMRNFDRNFTNILEENDNKNDLPLYEFYTDRMFANKVVVDRRIRFQSSPPKYTVFINGKESYLTNNEIQKVLGDINAIRIDENQIRAKSNKHDY
ncbi:MAG: hypothetical protein Satyrvirus23_18 [Satyrvirus sp.]|uniref:Uncharacterized protein n=1 Tax=Satyrvirus sp. TaxID=2487771 RepID=A0A3G5AEC9_9VIRU|nr:MAG: hypothetical protein Satyrvirus23_18 [Satyrvirus sp.]